MEELVKQLIEGQKQLIQSNKNLTTEIGTIKNNVARMEQESSRSIETLTQITQQSSSSIETLALLTEKNTSSIETLAQMTQQNISNIETLAQMTQKNTSSIESLKLDLTRMEQENNRKIGLLLDGWQEHEEKATVMEKQLDGITETLERIDLNMIKITTTQIKQSNILETLSVRSVEHEAELRSLKLAK